MTRDELIEEAARIIHADCVRGLAIYPNQTARKVADLFFAALKKPTGKMMRASWHDANTYQNRDIWQAMLYASPLAPEGGQC